MSVIGNCKKCGMTFEGNTSCHNSGSTEVNYNVVAKDHYEVHDGVKIKNNKKVGKRNRPALEEYCGDEQMRSTGEWVHKERKIDRENDLYHEKVVDPQTGNVMHECKEKLSEHLGHGSDKKGEGK